MNVEQVVLAAVAASGSDVTAETIIKAARLLQKQYRLEQQARDWANETAHVLSEVEANRRFHDARAI